jgi:hypothetical protein
MIFFYLFVAKQLEFSSISQFDTATHQCDTGPTQTRDRRARLVAECLLAVQCVLRSGCHCLIRLIPLLRHLCV